MDLFHTLILHRQNLQAKSMASFTDWLYNQSAVADDQFLTRPVTTGGRSPPNRLRPLQSHSQVLRKMLWYGIATSELMVFYLEALISEPVGIVIHLTSHLMLLARIKPHLPPIRVLRAQHPSLRPR